MILSIETGGEVCSVALSSGKELIALRESDAGRGHAQHLAQFIKDVLSEYNIDVKELEAIAVGKGPGSYTGLRIGVSVAKGLCYGANIPLIAVGSLESLTEIFLEDFEGGIVDIPSLEGALLCPMLDARRMEVYEQLFSAKGEALSEINAHVITPDSFLEQINYEKFIIFGSGAEKCVETLKVKGLHYVNVAQSARGVAKCAYRAFKEGRFEDVAYFEPLYLKEFVAAAPKKLL